MPMTRHHNTVQVVVSIIVILLTVQSSITDVVAPLSITDGSTHTSVDTPRRNEHEHRLDEKYLDSKELQRPQMLKGTVCTLDDEYILSTGDGVQLFINNEGSVTRLYMDGREILESPGDPFILHDVEQNLKWTAGGEAHIEGHSVVQTYLLNELEFQCVYTPYSGYIEMALLLQNHAESERAIDITFTLSVVRLAHMWWYDIDNRTRISEGQYYDNGLSSFPVPTKSVDVGNGRLPMYPYVVIQNSTHGLAYAVPYDCVVPYYGGYNTTADSYFLTISVGLSPYARIVNRALARFIMYRTDPTWGLRSAVQRFREFFPQYFDTTYCRQGVFSFVDPRGLPDEVEVGYRWGYFNQLNASGWGDLWGWGDIYDALTDDAYNIISVQYINPMGGHFFSCNKSQYQNESWVPTILESYRTSEKREERDAYWAAINCELLNGSGRREVIWWVCGDSYSFEIPGIAAPDVENFSLHDWYWKYWIVPSFESNEQIGIQMDGLFIDNLGTLYLTDYRPEHMQYVDVTLTYGRNTHRPVIYVPAVFTKYLSYVKGLLETRYGRHIPLMGNLGVGYPMTMHQVHLVDAYMLESFIGVWGASNPDHEWLMKRYRVQTQTKTIHGGDYNASTPECVEDYMQQCLFYAVYPFNNGNWTRDKDLYATYVPMVRRLSTAGWEPITHAWASSLTSQNSTFRIERYGSFTGDSVIPRDSLYLTTRNLHKSDTCATEVVVDGVALGLPTDILVYDLTTNQYVESHWDENSQLRFEVSLGPRETRVFWLFRPDLSVRSIAVDIQDPQRANSVKIVAHGTSNLPPVTTSQSPPPLVRFYLDGEVIGDSEMTPVNSTHFVSSITAQVQEPKIYNVTAFVDAMRTIGESDEDNNIRQMNVTLPLSWAYGLTISVDTGPYPKSNAIVKIPFAAGEYLHSEDSLDVASFRLVREEDAQPIPCQYLDGLGTIPSYVVFLIEAAPAHTTLRYTLYFDTLEHGSKMRPIWENKFNTVEKIYVGLNNDRGFLISPLSGTFFNINDRPDTYAWPVSVCSEAIGIWTYRNGVGPEQGYELFTGSVIADGPLVARVLYTHLSKGDYQSYGILNEIYLNGDIGLYPVLEYRESGTEEDCVRLQLQYHEYRRGIGRTGYYVNELGMLQSVKGNDNRVPKEAAEHWWGQRYDDGIYSTIVTQDERWDGGNICTEYYVSELYFAPVNRSGVVSLSAVVVAGIGDLDEMLLHTRNWVGLNHTIAQTTAPYDGSLWLWVATGVAVVTLIIVVIIIRRRSR